MEASDKRDLDSPKHTRRTFSRASKAELVDRAERGDPFVSRLAIEHRIDTNRLRKWITLARPQGTSSIATPILPVRVAEVPGGGTPSGGTLEVALAHATLRLRPLRSPGAVAALLSALR